MAIDCRRDRVYQDAGVLQLMEVPSLPADSRVSPVKRKSVKPVQLDRGLRIFGSVDALGIPPAVRIYVRPSSSFKSGASCCSGNQAKTPMPTFPHLGALATHLIDEYVPLFASIGAQGDALSRATMLRRQFLVGFSLLGGGPRAQSRRLAQRDWARRGSSSAVGSWTIRRASWRDYIRRRPSEMRITGENASKVPLPRHQGVLVSAASGPGRSGR